MKFTKANIKTIILILFSAVGFWMVLHHLSSVWAAILNIISILSPVILGICLAFVLSPLVDALEKGIFLKMTAKLKDGGKKLARGLSIIFSIIVVAGVLAAIVLLVIPEVEEAFKTIGETLPGSVTKAIRSINELLTYLEVDFRIGFETASNWEELLIAAKDTISEALETGVLKDIAHTATSVIKGFINFFMGLVLSVYMLSQREEVTLFMRRLIQAYFSKKTADNILDVSLLTRRCFRNFVSGQLLEALIIAALCFFGMLIFRFPYPTATSAVVGLTALIPVFGAWIGGIVGALLALSDSLTKALLFVVFLIGLQQLEGNIIYPRVVGKSMGLPGMLVFLSVLLGGSIGGVVGMLLAVPICAILYVLIKRSVARHLGEEVGPIDAPLAQAMASTPKIPPNDSEPDIEETDSAENSKN